MLGPCSTVFGSLGADYGGGVGQAAGQGLRAVVGACRQSVRARPGTPWPGVPAPRAGTAGGAAARPLRGDPGAAGRGAGTGRPGPGPRARGPVEAGRSRRGGPNRGGSAWTGRATVQVGPDRGHKFSCALARGLGRAAQRAAGFCGRSAGWTGQGGRSAMGARPTLGAVRPTLGAVRPGPVEPGARTAQGPGASAGRRRPGRTAGGTRAAGRARGRGPGGRSSLMRACAPPLPRRQTSGLPGCCPGG
jgi:hypothetical protein